MHTGGKSLFISTNMNRKTNIFLIEGATLFLPKGNSEYKEDKHYITGVRK